MISTGDLFHPLPASLRKMDCYRVYEMKGRLASVPCQATDPVLGKDHLLHAAPVFALQTLFANHAIALTAEDARRGMGLSSASITTPSDHNSSLGYKPPSPPRSIADFHRSAERGTNRYALAPLPAKSCSLLNSEIAALH